MPHRRAWATEENSTRSPSTTIVPAVGCMTPATIRINVLLPAPFSPTIANTSPRASVSDTSSNARTPEKCLLIWRTSSSGWGVDMSVPKS